MKYDDDDVHWCHCKSFSSFSKVSSILSIDVYIQTYWFAWEYVLNEKSTDLSHNLPSWGRRKNKEGWI